MIHLRWYFVADFRIVTDIQVIDSITRRPTISSTVLFIQLIVYSKWRITQRGKLSFSLFNKESVRVQAIYYSITYFLRGDFKTSVFTTTNTSVTICYAIDSKSLRKLRTFTGMYSTLLLLYSINKTKQDYYILPCEEERTNSQNFQKKRFFGIFHISPRISI